MTKGRRIGVARVRDRLRVCMPGCVLCTVLAPEMNVLLCSGALALEYDCQTDQVSDCGGG